ncbi:MAG TPA: GNAT family N-acetyltransferase [Flavobacteriaceae bacterium]|nr:GNAT family N-acetyltransferase [Flavobacteriaceae bacterium]
MINIQTKRFHQLSHSELYEILRLRAAVFVVEQNCVYQDIDSKDQNALHILGYHKNEIVAYARCFAPGAYFKEAAIGRILVKSNHRGEGWGHKMVSESVQAVIENFNTTSIRISAQEYLVDFYKSHGFKTVGEGYLEDGIPHVAMVYTD